MKRITTLFPWKSVFCVLALFCASTLFAQDKTGFQFKELDDKSIQLTENGKPVWVYNFGQITKDSVPLKDARRTRGCYIHPIYGINGEVLTDDFPRDHYHHHGAFWTWPHVGIHEPDGTVKEYDLWQGQATILPKFVQWGEKKTDGDAATLSVENGWFVGDKKVMVEKVKIRTLPTQPAQGTAGATRAIDLDFVWIPVDKPISLRGAEGKSYGGLTIRFKPGLNEKRRPAYTSITTPEGIASKDLPDTKLSWADYTSRFGTDEKRSGASIFIPPTHPDFPPTWLTRHYGALCVGWPGVKEKTFPAGEEIRLHYRIWIHESEADLPQIEKAYEEYSRFDQKRK